MTDEEASSLIIVGFGCIIGGIVLFIHNFGWLWFSAAAFIAIIIWCIYAIFNRWRQLAIRADRQHNLLLQGDLRGTYGSSPFAKHLGVRYMGNGLWEYEQSA